MGLRSVCLMQNILRESKKEKKSDFSQLVECMVFFESDFVGLEVCYVKYTICLAIRILTFSSRPSIEQSNII